MEREKILLKFEFSFVSPRSPPQYFLLSMSGRNTLTSSDFDFNVFCINIEAILHAIGEGGGEIAGYTSGSVKDG